MIHMLRRPKLCFSLSLILFWCSSARTFSTVLGSFLPPTTLPTRCSTFSNANCRTNLIKRHSRSFPSSWRPYTYQIAVHTRSRTSSNNGLFAGLRDNTNDDGDSFDNYDRNQDRDYQDALAANRIRTDILVFLTQRAIQSFLFLLVSCRDPHTVRWFENAYSCTNLNSYHGTGAFNLTAWGTWDSILLDMLDKPKQVVVISAKRRGRGVGGWSKDNPFLEERFVDFEIDIDPPSLVSRIMSVREQIAEEWAMDLDTFRMANDLILNSYHDRRRTARNEEEECINMDVDDKNVFASDQGDCISIEALEAAEENGQYLQQSSRVFDRAGPIMLSNSISFDEQTSSSFRKGNFDLLCLLATQESVHRVLRKYSQAKDTREISFQWLREFYVSRIDTFFDGNQPYGRADDFLEELLLVPPAVRDMGLSANNKQKVGLVDPLRIADDIIKERSQVAIDWKQVMVAVSQDHIQLRKALFEKHMSASRLDEALPTFTKDSLNVDHEMGRFE